MEAARRGARCARAAQVRVIGEPVPIARSQTVVEEILRRKEVLPNLRVGHSPPGPPAGSAHAQQKFQEHL
jgi:hypothetical protein